MKKVTSLNVEQFINKVMGLNVGEGFDFAGMTATKDLENTSEADLECWYGAKVIQEFDQRIALIGYYNGSPVAAISLDDDNDICRDNIKKVIEQYDMVDWKHEGCYIVEDNSIRHYKADILIDRENADYYNKLLNTIPQSKEDCLMGEDDTVIKSIEFFNGYYADIKICGVQFEQDGGDNNLPWTEGILFDKNGYEVCNITGDDFFGEWEFTDHNGDTYSVNVTESPVKEQRKALRQNKGEIER